MQLKNLRLVYVLLVFLMPIQALADVNSGFTASVSEGCAPLLVNFTSTVSGTSHDWTFGNGNASVEVNPSMTFINTGTYTVTLELIVNGNIETYTMQIVVHPSPVSSIYISGPSSGCTDLLVDFVDNSSAAGSPIVSYTWDFGDGVIETYSTSTDPSHLYTAAGTFSIYLIVTDQNGCIGTNATPVNVTATAKPYVGISALGGTIYCEIPASVQFLNSSSAAVSYQWNFGDGGSSSSFEPLYTYVAFGDYVVSLLVTDASGCTNSKSITDFIIVDTLEADFEIPAVICQDDSFQIVNTSETANTYSWQFNPGTSNLDEPEVSYSVLGPHTILLEATLNGNCSDTHSETIFVEGAIANFAYDPSVVCVLPQTVTMVNQSYTNSTSGPLTYEWILDFWSNSTQQNPSFLFSEDPALFHDYEEIFYDTLIVTSPNGCTDTAVTEFPVYLINVDFDMFSFLGCVEDSVTPIILNNSFYNSTFDSVISWTWDMGDGTTFSGYNPPPHVYPDTGLFPVYLIATTALGCVDTSNYFTVKVGDKQFPDFTVAAPDTFCAGDGKQIINLSVDAQYIDSYHWTCSDGVTMVEFEPIYYPVDTGWIDMNLLVRHNGCFSDTTIEDVTHVLGPIGTIQGFRQCEDPGPHYYDFVGSGIDFDHFYWNFGDGSAIDSVNLITSHWYLEDTVTTASMLWTNDTTGCSYQNEVMVQALIVNASISTDTTKVCVGQPLSFLANDSTLNEVEYFYFGEPVKYLWNFGDSTVYSYTLADKVWYASLIEPVSHIYLEKGIYTVQLTVVNEIGCRDTTSIVVEAIQPTPDIIVDPPYGCSPLMCDFTDLTVHPYDIISNIWTFGQGDTAWIASPDSVIFPTGIYMVNYTMTDTFGCVGETSYEMISASPDAEFTVNTVYFCFGDTIFTTNNSSTLSSDPTYIWDFGNGDTSNEFEPVYIYQDTGVFALTLTVIDAGCPDMMIVPTGNIVVQNPVTNIKLEYENNCAPVQALMICEPHHSYMTNHYWTFGDGSPVANVYPAEKGYYNDGTYTISLFVSTTAGCTHTATATLDVYDPRADFDLSTNEICLGDTVDINIFNVENVGHFYLSFGDGITDSTITSYTIPHIFSTAPEFNQIEVTLYVTDETGTCQSPSYFEIIDLFPARALFYRGVDDIDSVGCGSLFVQFIDSTQGADTYDWNFNDGSSGSGSSQPGHLFTEPGEYEVLLTITNTLHHCVVTEGKMIYVHPIPKLDHRGDSEICLDDTVMLWAKGGTSILWSPNENIDAVTSYSPIVSPPSSKYYSMTIEDENLCSAKDSIYVYVQTNPLLFLADTSIIIGDILEIDIPDNQHVEYYWSPWYNIDCYNCANPVFYPERDTTYYVHVVAYAEDKICYEYNDSIFINVDWLFTIDVPNMFTPNGDYVNDTVFVDGWGVKALIEFVIFNRWGQKVFESHDIKFGWDGKLDGIAQPNDTYIYKAKVLTHQDKELSLNGTLNLVR
jgi:gliding motility-associated-like protein